MQRRVFIGTGLIGAGMAEAAVGRGEGVTVWNRSRAKAERLRERGFDVVVADSLADAVRGQSRIHLALTSDAAVDQVLASLTGALEPEAIVMDHSTTSPAGSLARAERCESLGIRYLHTPVFMSPQACRSATGMILVCGPKALHDAVEAELSVMTGRVWYLGPRRDAAATFKLAGNAVNLAVVGALSDVYAIARAQGFDVEQYQTMLAEFDLRFVVSGRGAQMAKGDFATQWSLNMARKDVGLMMDAAADAPLTVLPALAGRMDQLIEQGQGEHDVAVIGRDTGDEATR